MLKLYCWVAMAIFIMAISLGWVLPYLISAAHTELVLLGVGYLTILPVVMFYIINSKINPIIKQMFEDAKREM